MHIAEIGSREVKARMVEVIEICGNCGNAPQAPEWDHCFGCGKSSTLRLWVPASECIEYGLNSPVGIRWTKFGPLGKQKLECPTCHSREVKVRGNSYRCANENCSNLEWYKL